MVYPQRGVWPAHLGVAASPAEGERTIDPPLAEASATAAKDDAPAESAPTDSLTSAVASQDAELDRLRARYDALGHAARERRATADASRTEHGTRMAALRGETQELRAQVRAAERAST